ncbi:hypothetical protein I5J44_gp33 [Mycobacterium phage Phineas]|uniref:hypothetical protein n=1 Tax=Mycobacterium phage Phineas TaxID=2575357 RepID=UPI0011620CE8|nr:hypothetical protein I5J44_gp33 [Mycobacterium phage Phineas]QDB74280.1 hypothetical protein SEA_PHINEAS_33 [Mycobacterium phage Phineas]UYL87560.1 hypothetical protein SEA_DYNAMO_33 [Mycobacterium phage Dynamo]WRQ08434.1 hypothetical protein JDBV10_00125 [Mycobacterium phage juyeon]
MNRVEHLVYAIRQQVRELIGNRTERGESTLYSLAILKGLQDKPIYYGSADAAAVAERRRRNKVARRSRRINRLAARR